MIHSDAADSRYKHFDSIFDLFPPFSIRYGSLTIKLPDWAKEFFSSDNTLVLRDPETCVYKNT